MARYANVIVDISHEKLDKISSSMSTASDAMNAFERMEQKADNMLDRANSTAELNEDVDAGIESLEDKYNNPSASVDEELEKLKKEMGM